MTTEASPKPCGKCPEKPATHHDTVNEEDICEPCAKDAALDRMVDDGEIEQLPRQPEPQPPADRTVFVCIEDRVTRTTGLCGEYTRTQRQLAGPKPDLTSPLPPIGDTPQQWCPGCLGVLQARQEADATARASRGTQ